MVRSNYLGSRNLKLGMGSQLGFKNTSRSVLVPLLACSALNIDTEAVNVPLGRRSPPLEKASPEPEARWPFASAV